MTTPAIILVRPQMVENIGMSARAMMNCGLSEMRIVEPRDPWPLESWLDERLHAASSGADAVLDDAKVFPTLEAATADLQHIYATTARNDRAVVKNWFTGRAAAADMRARTGTGQRIGILFGPERTGLTNDDLTLANDAITIPLNPAFSSLNLAQGVLLAGYEWYQAGDSTADVYLHDTESHPATKEELTNLFGRLETELETAGFFTTAELRPIMQRNLRNTLQRAQMTEQEVRTWHGVLSALVDGPKRAKKAS
ncbi:MAG: RNA methyltransferase [Alphaproteobacteria bacterium]|nr:RNA methyltransferase [Alphaproteobacteria bacterium]